MAMATQAARDGEPTSEINATPLIDVLLVLLIMLIVSLPPQRDVVSLNMPQNTKAEAPPPEPIRIAISDAGALSWNGAELSKAELDQRLDAIAASQPEIMILPTRLVRYSSVIAVMATVQRHGIIKMGVVEGA